MSKKQPKHDKSRDRRFYTYHPSRTFHLEWTDDPGDCYLYILDDRQTSLLRKMLQVFPKYHYIWGLPTPQADWDQAKRDLWNEIEAFVDDLEACLVSGCDLNEWLKQQRMLVAAIVGEAVDLSDPAQLSPDAVDFTAESATPGLVPKMDQMLNVDRSLYADMNIAEVLFEGLIGRRVSIPIPFEGTGLADIADEQLDVLHNRFRMTDSSLFNPLGGEKNLVEALETQLRLDKATDLEFLTPNLVTVMNQVMKLEDDSPLRTLFDQVYEWVTGNPAPPVPDYNTVAELLLLIAKGQQQGTTEPQPIELTTTTNVTCNCGGGGCGACCGGGPTTTEGEEGGDPPIGWDPPQDDTGSDVVPGMFEYQSRKCKLANIVHQNLVAMFEKLRENEVLKNAAEKWGASYLQIMTTMLTAIIGELATPVPILDGLIGGVIGFIIGSLLELLIGGIDIDEIVLTLTDPDLEEDLVCAFYNSTSVWNAKVEYITVLQNNGMGLNNAAFVEGFLIAELLNIFFFTKSELAVEIEAQLDGYVGPVYCSACADECFMPYVNLGGIVDETPGQITLSSEKPNDAHYVSLYFGSNELREDCGPSVTINSYTLTGFAPWGDYGYRARSTLLGGTRCKNADLHCSSDVPLPTPIGGVKIFSLKSTSPFTVTVSYQPDQ